MSAVFSYLKDKTLYTRMFSVFVGLISSHLSLPAQHVFFNSFSFDCVCAVFLPGMASCILPLLWIFSFRLNSSPFTIMQSIEALHSVWMDFQLALEYSQKFYVSLHYFSQQIARCRTSRCVAYCFVSTMADSQGQCTQQVMLSIYYFPIYFLFKVSI